MGINEEGVCDDSPITVRGKMERGLSYAEKRIDALYRAVVYVGDWAPEEVCEVLARLLHEGMGDGERSQELMLELVDVVKKAKVDKK